MRCSLAGLMAGLFCLLAATASPNLVRAADWPTRPVKLIVPYPAGSATDSVARPFTEPLAKKLGQPFVIENKAGAAGAIGAEAAARSAPDGYTFLAGPNAPLVLLPQLRKLPYSPNDLAPAAILAEGIYGFAVLPTLGPKSIAELVALAKARPGELTYMSPGSGSSLHLRNEVFKVLAGIDLLHVPYRTGAEAITDFLAGRVHIMLDNTTFPQVRAGKAILLGIVADQRHPDFPDVPTMAETGYPIDVPIWSGLYAPKGTPPEILERLGAAVAEIAASPDIQALLLKFGWMASKPATPAELAARLDREVALYEGWVKRTDLKID